MKPTDLQRKAVETDAEKAIVFAGAGSGKTRVLMARVMRLLEAGVCPTDLLVLTFTRRAAEEMRARLVEAQGGGEVAEGVVRLLLLGTFHAVALRILTAYGDRIGYRTGSLTVLDEEDAELLLLRACEDLGLFDERTKKWKSGLSKSKVKSYVEDYYVGREVEYKPREQDLLARIMKEYHSQMRSMNLLDFGQVLHECNRLFLEHEDVLTTYRERIKHVLLDESQDTDMTQYVLHNWFTPPATFFAVGDPRQCIPKGQLVATPTGNKRIESIRAGDVVLAADNGRAVPAKVLRVSKTKKASILGFGLDNGKTFRATPDHVCFAAIDDPHGWYVYVMYRPDLGYRIGVSQTAGSSGQCLTIRTQQEQAERMWVVEWHPTYAMAARREAHLSYSYRIPREPFKARNGMWCGKKEIKELFGRFGKNGRVLLREQGLDFELPNYMAKSSGSKCISVNLAIGGSKGHQVSIESKNVPLRASQDLGMKPSRRGCLRVRRWFSDLRRASEFAKEAIGLIEGTNAPPAYVVETLGGTRFNRRMFAVRAASLHQGMNVPFVTPDGTISTAKITSRKSCVVGEKVDCFDLSIDKLGTFVVNGVVVHNCVYSWRGARPDLMIDLPDASYFDLPECFRCGDRIVDVANRLIANGMDDVAPLLGATGRGGTVELVSGRSADIAKTCQRLHDEGCFAWNEIAVLARKHTTLKRLAWIFREELVPYVRVGSAIDVCKSPEFRAIFATFRACTNPHDNMAFTRLFLHSWLNISNEEYAKIRQQAAVDGTSLLQAFLKTDLAGLGVGPIITEYDPADTVTRVLDKLKKLGTEAGRFWTDQCEEETIPEALAWYAAWDAKKGEDYRQTDAVTLITAHAAKGLEWPAVVVAGMNEGDWPTSRSIRENAVEEERRLLYVAITRAREHCVVHRRIPADQSAERPIKEPSRFLRECGIPGHQPDGDQRR